jgi:uncharacterized protein (TIGR03437 family)
VNSSIFRLAAALAFSGLILWAQGGGTPPPGGGGSSSSSVTYYATYKLDGGAASQADQTYSATAADTSAVWVANSGVLTLTNPTIVTSGNTSSQDNSSFYGLNAGLLVTSGKATVTGGTIATTGTGANGAFATGSSASVVITNVTITGKSDGAHAVMATQGGTMTLTNVNMVTSGGSSSAVSTDRGGGTITVTGGSITTSGGNSACIYSTGSIILTGVECKATGAEGAVIEGANSITLTNTNLSVTKEKWGAMIYQSMSGDASGNRGTFTMTGGSFTYAPTSGPLFYVNNTTGIITLKGVTLSAASGDLIKAAAGSWGASGSNGGKVVLTADSQTMTGDMSADSISSIAATLQNKSTLSGKLTNVALSLDVSSVWNLTGNSVLTSLVDPEGISGTTIANIKGNGYTVTYDATLSGNSYLGGKTYSLANGGTLAPAGGSPGAGGAPSITTAGILNAASGATGVAPGAWIALYGANLSTAAVAAAASDLVNGYLPTTLGGTSVKMNGKPAFLNYVSPVQINLQAPDDATASGTTVTVSVTTSGGTSSAEATLRTVMPGIFTLSNYVLAVRPADLTIINGTGDAYAGFTTAAAARAGDVLAIYATGLGPTTTAVPAGLVFSGAYPATTLPTVTVGTAAATVSWCGLVASGEYQINFTVPATLAAGSYPVVLTHNGAASPASAALLKIAN